MTSMSSPDPASATPRRETRRGAGRPRPRPQALPVNQVEHFYPGGDRIAALRGQGAPGWARRNARKSGSRR